MIHTEVLTEEAKHLFPLLAKFKNDFYLAGGTALALELGHRISIDFDLFCAEPIKKTLLARVEEVYKNVSTEVLINNSRELTLLINGVKHTFLQYPFPTILPLVEDEYVPLLSAKELLVTKAYTIGRRGTFKDYVDLYIGLSEEILSLTELIKYSQEKYGNAFNDRLFLEQMLYLDDISEDPLVMLDRALPTKDLIREFFLKIIPTVVV